MVQDRLEQLCAIDPMMLAEVVRQDQRSSSFEITDWTVERLSSRGMVNPDGLFHFSGHGRRGPEQATRPWSVALKIVQQRGEERAPREIWYWKRELLAAQSRLLEHLPGPVMAPRFYDIVEHPDSGWLWMEHLGDSAGKQWTLEQYAFAARALGCWSGAYLTGTPLPDYPWLTTEHCRWWLAMVESGKPEQAWDNRFVKGAFSESVRPRVERLWAEKERWLAVLNQVPQVFSHFDFHRRNLFLRARDDDVDEVVAVDWAWVGTAALGGDLCSLIVGSALLFDVEPEELPALEASATAAYLAGLREVGWQGDSDLVRLGYSAWLALWIGATAPSAAAFWTSDQAGETELGERGRGPEALAAGLATLCELALDRADEARQLMDRLRLG